MPPDSSVPESADISLVSDIALKERQVDALGELYDRYARLVYGLAFKILRNLEEAEDITQEVFLTLWYRHAYDPARGSLSSFLVTITRSRAIDRLRSCSTRRKFLQRWAGAVKAESISALPLDQASFNERWQRVRDALAQLPETERQVLEIAYYEGLSQSEIAKRLNTPLGTVKTRSRQGLMRLRQALQGYL
jgi:RNA polymerase sigma-70 factor (ECF subfamily)